MGKGRKLKQLRKAAQLFPTTMETRKVRMLGADILKQKPDMKMANGKALDKELYYFVDVTVPKSQYNELRRLYNTGGMEAVNKYMHGFADDTENAVLATNEIAASIENRGGIVAGI